jgi:hypothetical protein
MDICAIVINHYAELQYNGAVNYSKIPTHMRYALLGYINEGNTVGDFLTAIICNDLKEAVGRADLTNMPLIHTYTSFMYNEAPAICWGSKADMDSWINKGGMQSKTLYLKQTIFER